MSSDVPKSVWGGRIPLALAVEEAEATHFGAEKAPSPIFLEVPRISYLTLLTGQVRDIYTVLGLSLPESTSEIWFEYQGKPLKWHYPIGLLYDILCTTERSYRQQADPKPLPWCVNVHFRNYPANSLFRDQSKYTARDYFMSMIKEADFLRFGSTKRVMNLSTSDQTQLWESLCSNDFESFWKVNQRLVHADDQSIRHIPLRLYLPDDCPVIQDRILPHKDDGEDVTIRRTIQQLLPDLQLNNGEREIIALCHGVAIPLETPIIWASRHLTYPDNFLHFTLY